ncbi:MAG: chorismate-binding protein [Alphaproteobacteria bacterium]|nr:chorismate-binding protein [Alphaproteobacteria bacterium]
MITVATMTRQLGIDMPAGQPFALVVRGGEEEATFLTGQVRWLDRLEDLPRKSGPGGQAGIEVDSLNLIPYRQVTERGFEAHDDGRRIASLEVAAQHRVATDAILEAIPAGRLHLTGDQGFDVDDETYAGIVRRIIEDEIAQGEGANFVISRAFNGQIEDFDEEKALVFFRNLLADNYGSYWTYIYYTGEAYYIGMSPERHISCERGVVKMNPISGTFRKLEHTEETARDELLRFLGDEKEIFELFMVVDEELKMMAQICEEGGEIFGPFLKEMTNIVHTEYVLAGQSKLDILEQLRLSMYAPTVTGSPIENACRIIKKYEPGGRSYYSSVIAMVGRDEDGNDYLDAPITIRAAEVSKEGNLSVRVGATLVRNSKPADETEETHAKIAGVLKALSTGAGANKAYRIGDVSGDAEIMDKLEGRNVRLSRFWTKPQTLQRDNLIDRQMRGKLVSIVDCEDEFVMMLKHIIRSFGCRVEVHAVLDYDPNRDPADVVILGPGPGDPSRRQTHAKVARCYEITEQFLTEKRAFLAVCLSHQVLGALLGYDLIRKADPTQGVQREIDYFGRAERVGFYNTFAVKHDDHRDDLSLAVDEANGEINAMRSDHFASMQFHAESILTENGFHLVRDTLKDLLVVASEMKMRA